MHVRVYAFMYVCGFRGTLVLMAVCTYIKFIKRFNKFLKNWI